MPHTIKPVALIRLHEPKKESEKVSIPPEVLDAIKKAGIKHIALLPICPPVERTVSHSPQSTTYFIRSGGRIMRRDIGDIQNQLKKEQFILVNKYVDFFKRSPLRNNFDDDRILNDLYQEDQMNPNSKYRYIPFALGTLTHGMETAITVRLSVACENYLNHLKESREQSSAKEQPGDATKLIDQKINMVGHLKRHADAGDLNKFKELFQKTRPMLEARRDSATRYFLKVLLSIFTLGLAPALGLWKVEGKKVADEFSAALDDKESLTPTKKPQ